MQILNSLPSGTVTFLFTDIEGSTKLAQAHPDQWPQLQARHHALMHQVIETHNGYVFQIIGDAFCAAFSTAPDALDAAVEAQHALGREAWVPVPILVRMGIHTGVAQASTVDAVAGGYTGYATLALVQRVMSAAHGGQILVSHSTAELVRAELPAGISLRDMGEHRLKGVLNLERIWQLTAPDLTADFPPLLTLNSIPNNLPTQLTSFVGREKEIAEIKAMLTSARLVTLTGSGGTGKTRLSIEIGAQELASFANGVWFIELAPLSDPAQIIPALAQAFGLQELPQKPLADTVTDYVREKKLLLILDNCEHLIAACAHLANDLLHHCAELEILASSREALGIAGEVAYRTPSLANSESTRLFVERARAANPKFSLTDSNASSVAQICSRLDGIPLAIELAAARTKLLSPEQIAARLDDLFRLLVGGSRTALPRQQTLRALIDWSYDLLSEEEKQLLRNASVFMGGWTLDALEAISEDPNAIELLEQLINKSLVVTEERKNEMRYFMLETIRQYAREKLFEAKQSSAARDRHLSYYENFSEKMWNEGHSANGLIWGDKAVDELDNLRAAMKWGMAHDAEAALHLAANFCMILSWSGKITEGRALLRAALERINTLPPVEGDAQIHRQKLIGRAFFAEAGAAFRQGDPNQLTLALQKAIELSRLTGDKVILGYCLAGYFIHADSEKLPGGPEALEEGGAILTELGDSVGIFFANLYQARLAAIRGNLEERQFYLKRTEEMMKDMPSSLEAAAEFYIFTGMDERTRGNYQAARPYFEEALKTFQKLGQKYYENVVRSELGHIARLSGDLPQAKAIYRQTLMGWQDSGSRAAIANQFECFAFIAVLEGKPQRAATLFGAAEALREQAQSLMAEYERVEYDQSVAALRAMLPAGEFNSLWAEGRAMSMGRAIQFALGDNK